MYEVGTNGICPIINNKTSKKYHLMCWVLDKYDDETFAWCPAWLRNANSSTINAMMIPANKLAFIFLKKYCCVYMRQM